MERSHNLVTTWRRLCSDRRAVTAIEYVMIASVLSIVIIAGVLRIGVSVSNTFGYLGTHL